MYMNIYLKTFYNKNNYNFYDKQTFITFYIYNDLSKGIVDLPNFTVNGHGRS